MLSDELLASLETGERAAIESLGQFVVAVEEALPQEVAGTAEVAKKVTESGVEMADRLIQAQSAFLRKAIHSVAKALSRDGAKLQAAHNVIDRTTAGASKPVTSGGSGASAPAAW